MYAILILWRASPSLPEAGTVCGRAARAGLCGGRRATGVPTATQGIELIRNTYMTNGQFNTPLNDFKSFNGVCIVRLKEQKAERLMKIRGGININYISYI